MILFEFHINGTDEVFTLHSTQHVPRRGESVVIVDQEYFVYTVVSKYKKLDNGCWLENVLIYLDKNGFK